MVEPDTIIDDRYRVISRLGSGGMADVYLAHDQLLGRQVAVKILHHHFAEDHEFVERFRREASSAAALSHPNIVAIFDRGEWNGTYYIAMEYVAGRSLKAIVREGGALGVASAIEIVVQILRAARFAHRRGVIHRDLKPHNVILDEEGRARVTDFGIARAGASDMTLTGSIMGTAQYLSPEQAQGHTVSGASDLYSVGVILYELLTGVVPFEGESAVAIAVKQVSAVPRAPSECNPAIPPSLDAVVLRALAKDPGERYADADELIAALLHERDALPAFSPVMTAIDGQVHHVQPHPPPPATGALLLAPAGRDEHDPLAEGGEQRQRDRRVWWWALAAAVVIAAAVIAVLLLGSKQTVTVPDVAGQSEQAAGATLRRAGLSSVPALASNSKVPIGLVVSQTPRAGSKAEKGSGVSIVVSGGPASAALMNVTGLTTGQAASELRKAGFKPVSKTQSSATLKSGLVISTEPPAGTEVLLGSSVTMLVSSGPAPVNVPDLTGQSQSTAEAEIAEAKLELGIVSQKTSTTESPGTVMAQSPTAGRSVRVGTKVNLTVAQEPKETAVPSVVGQNEVSAVAALETAGFKAKTANEATSEAAQVGTVLKQSPAAGAKARKGATVTIAIGTLAQQTTTTPTTPTTSTPTTATPPPAAAG